MFFLFRFNAKLICGFFEFLLSPSLLLSQLFAGIFQINDWNVVFFYSFLNLFGFGFLLAACMFLCLRA